MFLKSVQYSEFENTNKGWSIEKFPLKSTNLIVGQNAEGKTRVLNIIKNIAKLINGEHKMGYYSGQYKLLFEKDSKEIEYILNYENAVITKESLAIGQLVLIDREKDGIGKIYSKDSKSMIEFKIPKDELICVFKRDELKYPFLEDLYNWAKYTYHYSFGSSMGKNNIMTASLDNSSKGKVNLKNTQKIVEIYSSGLVKFKDKFTDKIKQDMKKLKYNIEDISLVKIPAHISSKEKIEWTGISIKEKDIDRTLNQTEISQGMFKALSLIIQLNFCKFQSIPSLILIDDIGEGLDYERSKALFDLLLSNTRKDSVKLIMTTNDRFVMNIVPIDYWLIINRKNSKCKVINYENSKEIFDDFKYTGLSNFDFFSSKFYLKGLNKK